MNLMTNKIMLKTDEYGNTIKEILFKSDKFFDQDDFNLRLFLSIFTDLYKRSLTEMIT